MYKHVKLLTVDLDDTLIPCRHQYRDACFAFERMIAEWGYGDLADAGVAIDQANKERQELHQHGPVALRDSMAIALERLKAQPYSDEEFKALTRLVKDQVEHASAEPFPGVPETLDYLSGKYRLILVTQGNSYHQGARIAKSGLGGYFERQHVLDHKTPERYGALCVGANVEPRNAVNIGDSPVRDIVYPLQAGMRAIMIDTTFLWAWERHERPFVDQNGQPADILTLDRFEELKEVL